MPSGCSMGGTGQKLCCSLNWKCNAAFSLANVIVWPNKHVPRLKWPFPLSVNTFLMIFRFQHISFSLTDSRTCELWSFCCNVKCAEKDIMIPKKGEPEPCRSSNHYWSNLRLMWTINQELSVTYYKNVQSPSIIGVKPTFKWNQVQMLTLQNKDQPGQQPNYSKHKHKYCKSRLHNAQSTYMTH